MNDKAAQRTGTCGVPSPPRLSTLETRLVSGPGEPPGGRLRTRRELPEAAHPPTPSLLWAGRGAGEGSGGEGDRTRTSSGLGGGVTDRGTEHAELSSRTRASASSLISSGLHLPPGIPQSHGRSPTIQTCPNQTVRRPGGLKGTSQNQTFVKTFLTKSKESGKRSSSDALILQNVLSGAAHVSHQPLPQSRTLLTSSSASGTRSARRKKCWAWGWHREASPLLLAPALEGPSAPVPFIPESPLLRSPRSQKVSLLDPTTVSLR